MRRTRKKSISRGTNITWVATFQSCLDRIRFSLIPPREVGCLVVKVLDHPVCIVKQVEAGLVGTSKRCTQPPQQRRAELVQFVAGESQERFRRSCDTQHLDVRRVQPHLPRQPACQPVGEQDRLAGCDEPRQLRDQVRVLEGVSAGLPGSRSGTAAPRDRSTGLPPPIGRPPARAAWFACTGSRSQRAINIVGPRGNVHMATDIVRYRFSAGTTTVWFGSFDGLATTRPFGSPLLRPDAQSAVSRSACPLRRRRAVRPGPVAPTAWDRNPSGRSATSRSTASRVCAANRACASSCSCFVCKEEQARRFRAPGRQMEELGFSDAEIKGREYWDQYIDRKSTRLNSSH